MEKDGAPGAAQRGAPWASEAISRAARVANVGCYASSAIALLRPLVDAGLIAPDHPLTINAVSGYSGGGKQMIEAYDQIGGNLVAVVDVPREQTNKYGILDVASDDGKLAKIKGLVEKPEPAVAPSTLSIIGRYILQPSIFAELEAKRAGAGGEIQLTDSMAKLIGREPFHGLRYEGTRYDCGDKAGFIEANAAFALAHPEIGPQVRDVLRKLVS